MISLGMYTHSHHSYYVLLEVVKSNKATKKLNMLTANKVS